MLEGVLILRNKFDGSVSRCLALNNGWKAEKSLALIILSISDVCNRECVHCPRGNNYKHPKDLPLFMSLETVVKLCTQLGKEYNGCISISGLGEPLLHENIKEIILIIKTLCPQSSVFIVTNGDYLTEDIIAMHLLSHICISTYSEEEYQGFYDKYKDNAKIILLKHYGDNTNNRIFNNRAGNVYECEQLSGGCRMPFFQATIDTDGKVYQCSCDWKRENPLGDIYVSNIYDIFINGFKSVREKLYYGRRNETILCKRCSATVDDFDGVMSEFINGWINYYKEC